MSKIRKLKLAHWHKVSVLLILYDMVAVTLAFFLGLWFRFDCTYSEIPYEYMGSFIRFAPIYAVTCIPVFVCVRMYNSIWRYASFTELIRVITATAITGVMHSVGITLLFKRMPVSYYIIGTGIQFLLLLGVRFSYRFILLERNKVYRGVSQRSRVMLVGAGNAGQMILQDVSRLTKDNLEICCIIDDNPNKWGRYLCGVPIVGGREDILLCARKFCIDKIFVALPSASEEDKRDILNICKETGCELKNLPGMYQLVSGQVSVSDMRDVAVEDLLGRDTICVNMDEIYSYISGKTILVTGGGGSIGSELCRQVAAHNPRLLVIFDVY